MKTILPVIIWANGKDTEAKVLNTYAVNVTLNLSASFYWALYAETETGDLGDLLSQGNLSMTGEAYQTWTTDNIAWDYVAAELSLTITGEFVPPIELPI